MTDTVVQLPLVGGPGDGHRVEAQLDDDGLPPPAVPWRRGATGASIYELTRTERGFAYVFNPNPEPGLPDFAPEHASVTLAGEMPGGPEGQVEDDSPRGLAGAD